MPPGTQRHARTKMVLPLRVWLDEQDGDNAAPQLAHTVDISPGGGRLGGLRSLVQSGEIILIQRGQQRAQFRVVWAKQMGPGEIQAGVELLDLDEKVWGIDLPGQPNALGNPGTASAPPARRTARTDPISHSLSTRLRSAASLDTQIRWSVVVGTLLIALASVVYIQRRSAQHSEAQVENGVSPAAQVETSESSSPMRPHGNERVFTFLKDEQSGSASSRVRVAEAPQGHTVYPVSPDASLSGRVDLKIIIASDGRVKQVEVLSGKQRLVEAAARAVRLWRYAQHESNGHPAEAETSAVIQFRAGDAVSIHFPSVTANKVERSRPAAIPAQYASQ